jgi:hypothetical protein
VPIVGLASGRTAAARHGRAAEPDGVAFCDLRMASPHERPSPVQPRLNGFYGSSLNLPKLSTTRETSLPALTAL